MQNTLKETLSSLRMCRRHRLTSLSVKILLSSRGTMRIGRNLSQVRPGHVGEARNLCMCTTQCITSGQSPSRNSDGTPSSSRNCVDMHPTRRAGQTDWRRIHRRLDRLGWDRAETCSG
jgi:hypothetical protein